jgi:CheY-like chemotaxis protein
VRIIEELGYCADIATTAREAIEAQARLPYAAVLLPSQMPGIDGIAAAMHIRQQESQAGTHTLLIGILQFKNNAESAQCLSAGMDEVLVKPLRSASLKTTLDHSGQLLAERNTSHLVPSDQVDERVEVDLRAALARVDGDKELFDEITALFIEEYPKTLGKMLEAITRQDPQALAYSANALKSALGNFAAMKAMDTAARLELMGRCGDLSQAQPLLNDLDKHLARLHVLLADFRLRAVA